MSYISVIIILNRNLQQFLIKSESNPLILVFYIVASELYDVINTSKLER